MKWQNTISLETHEHSQKFRVQLGTLVDAVEKSGSVDFKWIDGGHNSTPPSNFADFFGPPPHYRFFEYDGMSALDSMVTKIREFPAGLTAEDTIRKLVSEDVMSKLEAVQSTLDRIFGILDEDPSIDVRSWTQL